jgi:hypothetical protein
MNQAPSGATWWPSARTEYAAPTGLGSSPTRCDGATARRVVWERMPKAGEGFSFFGFGSTNMPRRRRWGRTPCQNHFALDVWGIWRLNLRRQIMNIFNQIFLEFIKLALVGIIGGLIGARANDKLARRREQDAGRDSRKRDFLAFVASWRSEIYTPPHKDGMVFLDDGGVLAFLNGLHQFNAEKERVRNDYSNLEKFAQLVGAVGNLNVGRAENQINSRKIILKTLDALIDFIK